MRQPVRPTYRSWRPRLSLLNAILLMTIVAMGFVIWRLYRELPPLRNEVRQWRNQAGVLTVEDKSKMHAIYRTTYDEQTWRWRVYLPPEHDYWLCLAVNEVRRGEFPDAALSILLGDRVANGEYDIAVAVRKGIDGEFQFVIESKNEQRGGVIRQPIRRGKGTWPEKQAGSSITEGTELVTRAEQKDGRLLLLQHFVGLTDRSAKSGKTPTDGLKVWIERRAPLTESQTK
jgi:hypothetical protein